MFQNVAKNAEKQENVNQEEKCMMQLALNAELKQKFLLNLLKARKYFARNVS